MPLLADAIRASRNESARYRSDAGVSVQRDDAWPAETFDADDLAATLDALRSLHRPGFVPESDCWQPADVHVDQWTHSV